MAPVFTARNDNMSMLAIQEATGATQNWIHAMNFVLLRNELLPAFATICSLIRLLIVDHVPEEITRQQVYELLIITSSTLDLQGGPTQMDHFKHCKNQMNIVIYFNRNVIYWLYP
jgi:hypothetical protein